jgi:hypothetical protein
MNEDLGICEDCRLALVELGQVGNQVASAWLRKGHDLFLHPELLRAGGSRVTLCCPFLSLPEGGSEETYLGVVVQYDGGQGGERLVFPWIVNHGVISTTADTFGPLDETLAFYMPWPRMLLQMQGLASPHLTSELSEASLSGKPAVAPDDFARAVGLTPNSESCRRGKIVCAELYPNLFPGLHLKHCRIEEIVDGGKPYPTMVALHPHYYPQCQGRLFPVCCQAVYRNDEGLVVHQVLFVRDVTNDARLPVPLCDKVPLFYAMETSKRRATQENLPVVNAILWSDGSLPLWAQNTIENGRYQEALLMESRLCESSQTRASMLDFKSFLPLSVFLPRFRACFPEVEVPSAELYTVVSWLITHKKKSWKDVTATNVVSCLQKGRSFCLCFRGLPSRLLSIALTKFGVSSCDPLRYIHLQFLRGQDMTKLCKQEFLRGVAQAPTLAPCSHRSDFMQRIQELYMEELVKYLVADEKRLTLTNKAATAQQAATIHTLQQLSVLQAEQINRLKRRQETLVEKNGHVLRLYEGSKKRSYELMHAVAEVAEENKRLKRGLAEGDRTLIKCSFSLNTKMAIFCASLEDAS